MEKINVLSSRGAFYEIHSLLQIKRKGYLFSETIESIEFHSM